MGNARREADAGHADAGHCEGASQLVTRSTRHSPKSYDELTGGLNTVLWRVDRRLKRRAVTAVSDEFIRPYVYAVFSNKK